MYTQEDFRSQSDHHGRFVQNDISLVHTPHSSILALIISCTHLFHDIPRVIRKGLFGAGFLPDGVQVEGINHSSSTDSNGKRDLYW